MSKHGRPSSNHQADHLKAFPNPNWSRYLRSLSFVLSSRSIMRAPGFESKPRRIASAKTVGTSQPHTLADQLSFALRPFTSQRRFWELFGPQTRRCRGENFQFAKGEGRGGHDHQAARYFQPPSHRSSFQTQKRKRRKSTSKEDHSFPSPQVRTLFQLP